MSGDIALSRGERFKRNQESFRLAKEKLSQLERSSVEDSPNGIDNVNEHKNGNWKERKEKDETCLDYYVGKTRRPSKSASVEQSSSLNQMSPEKRREDYVKKRSVSRNKVVLSVTLTEEKSTVESVTTQSGSPNKPEAICESPPDSRTIEEPFRTQSSHRNGMSSGTKLSRTPRTVESTTGSARAPATVDHHPGQSDRQGSVRPSKRQSVPINLNKPSANSDRRTSVERTNIERPKQHIHIQNISKSPRNPSVRQFENSKIADDITSNNSHAKDAKDSNVVDVAKHSRVKDFEGLDFVDAVGKRSRSRNVTKSSSKKVSNSKVTNIFVNHVAPPSVLTPSNRLGDYTDSVLDMFSDTSLKISSFSPRISSVSPKIVDLSDDEPDVELFSSVRRKQNAVQKPQHRPDKIVLDSLSAQNMDKILDDVISCPAIVPSPTHTSAVLALLGEPHRRVEQHVVSHLISSASPSKLDSQNGFLYDKAQPFDLRSAVKERPHRLRYNSALMNSKMTLINDPLVIKSVSTDSSILSPSSSSVVPQRPSRNRDDTRRTKARSINIDGNIKSSKELVDHSSVLKNKSKIDLPIYKTREYSAEPRPLNRRMAARDIIVGSTNEIHEQPSAGNKPMSPSRGGTDLQSSVMNIIVPRVTPLKQNKTNINSKPPLPKSGKANKAGSKSERLPGRSASVSAIGSIPERSNVSKTGAPINKIATGETKKSFWLPWNKISSGRSIPEKEKTNLHLKIGERLSNGQLESLKRSKPVDNGNEIPATIDIEAMVKESLSSALKGILKYFLI